MQWINTDSASGISPYEILHELKKQLWFRANVLRSEELSQPALQWIQSMRKEYNAARAYASGFDLKISMQAFHALRTAESLLKAVMLREESRGPHFRSDFPQRRNELNGFRVMITEQEREITAVYD